MMNWIKSRMKERTSWDGAMCIALGCDSIHGTTRKDCGGVACVGCLDYLEIRIS